MKLTDLDPHFVGYGGEGVRKADGSPVPRREGIGLKFRCPCGHCDSPIFVSFENPLDGGPKPSEGMNYLWAPPTWRRTGETFETLTLTPSILRNKEKGGCGWHGFITDGEVISRLGSQK